MTAVPFFRPNIGDAEIELVTSSLRSGWLTSGPRVAEFESAFAAAVGAQHAVALNSCTAALHLALLAHGVGPGDEVVVPTMTFAATAEVVVAVGAVPVLVDSEPDTLALDLTLAERAITSRTRALMVMHYGGSPADMDGVMALKTRHPDLVIIEDAAHAFPAAHALGPIGSLGDATCFSFYANKTITTGEGGMLTTDNPDVAARARQLSLHGLSRDAWSRFETRSSWDYDIVDAGWKYNMTDAAASLGLAQLERADEFASMRRSIAHQYTEAIGSVPGITPRDHGDLSNSAAHLFVVYVDSSVFGITRNELISHFTAADIGTSVHYRPLHMHSYYVKTQEHSPEDFPVASQRFNEILSLPIFPGMSAREVDSVVEQVIAAGR